MLKSSPIEKIKVENIRNWQNRPTILKNINSAMQKQNIFQANEEVQTIRFIQIDWRKNYPVAIVAIVSNKNNNEREFAIRINEKGEFKSCWTICKN